MAKKPTVSDDTTAITAKPARKPRVRKAVAAPVADAAPEPAQPKRARRSKTAPAATPAVAPAADAVTTQAAPTPAPPKPRAPRKPRVRTPKSAPADLLVAPIPAIEPAPTPAPDPTPEPEPEPIAAEPPPAESAPADPAPQPAAPPPIHDHGLDHGLSPVDLPPMEQADLDAAGLGWMARVLIISSLLLVLFNSFAIDKWARALPVTATSGRIVDIAALHHQWMDNIDANLPLETARSAWHWVKDVPWPGADSAADDSAAPTADANPTG